MNTIIFDSELKFRKYLIKNSSNIIYVILLEDKLDNTIFFYSLTKDNYIIASKELLSDNYDYYSKIYIKLVNKLNLDIEYTTKNPKSLKLIRNK